MTVNCVSKEPPRCGAFATGSMLSLSFCGNRVSSLLPEHPPNARMTSNGAAACKLAVQGPDSVLLPDILVCRGGARTQARARPRTWRTTHRSGLALHAVRTGLRNLQHEHRMSVAAACPQSRRCSCSATPVQHWCSHAKPMPRQQPSAPLGSMPHAHGARWLPHPRCQ
jgi:hypothetical protein